MFQAGHRRRLPILALGIVIAASVGVVALPIDRSILTDPVDFLNVRFSGFPNTGFSIRSVDGSLMTINGLATFDPAAGLQANEQVQEGFILLDGTMSLALTAEQDGTRVRALTTYQFDVRRRSLDARRLARTLVRRHRATDERALIRARAMTLDDARVMRFIEPEGRWKRAVRALTNARIRAFRPETDPDGMLGHFGTARSASGDPYVWAVMDRNSRYAVGVTLDRDNDGVPNSADNCIGSPNANQSDADGDAAGDACDLDDDNDSVADAADNCPLASNADQHDLDKDGMGDACDVDDDSDGVADGADLCPATAQGSVIDATGCSIVDHCPCESAWRNHGAYVQCVARTSGQFVSAGLISQSEKDAIVSAAGRSICGF